MPGLIPERGSTHVGQFRPFLYKPVGSFPYGFLFLCLCLHEEIKCCNLYPGVPEIASGFYIGAKRSSTVLSLFVVAGKEIGLVVNADKTKLMLMAREPNAVQNHVR